MSMTLGWQRYIKSLDEIHIRLRLRLLQDKIRKLFSCSGIYMHMLKRPVIYWKRARLISKEGDLDTNIFLVIN